MPSYHAYPQKSRKDDMAEEEALYARNNIRDDVRNQIQSDALQKVFVTFVTYARTVFFKKKINFIFFQK